MEALRKDIEVYNPGFRLAVTSRWITNAEARNTKFYGSVVISFDDFDMHRKPLRHKLWIGGVNCYTCEFKETRPTDRCTKCQRYGHMDVICPNSLKCLYCTQDHPIRAHVCSQCTAHGECHHVRCINCGEKHSAENRICIQ
jgi:hypothetical protein